MTEQAVLDTVTNMTRAFHQLLISEVMAAYEDDAVVAFKPGELSSTRQAIENGFEQAFQVKPRFEYAAHEVLSAGGLALHFAPWKMTATTPDGQHVEEEGLSVAVLRQQQDGAWKLVIDNPYGQRLWESARFEHAARRS